MNKVKIALHGCDDSTYFDMEVTAEQFEFLQKVKENANNASSYGCMPTMEVEKYE